MYAQWGGNRGYSNVRLNYNALDRELIDKAKFKTGWIKYRSILFIHGHGSRAVVTAYRLNADTIALKLHRTEIIHYHSNGLRTLYGGGWIGSQQTQHWFAEASIRICGVKPNNWSAKQYCVATADWKPTCVFYDGMQLNQDGEVITKHKPVITHVPNAEAKVLRKRLTKLAQIYRAFAMLHAGSKQDLGTNRGVYDIPRIDPATHEFDLDLYRELLGYWQQKFSNQTPYQRVQAVLAKVYEQEVHRRNLLDVKPVLGEANE